MKRTYKVLLLFDSPTQQPRGYDYKEEFATPEWVTEAGVYTALCNYGHTVRLLGVHNNLEVLFEEVKEEKPEVIFNLTEVFNTSSHFEKNIAWILEMLGIPYTGASPANLLVCNDKGLSKKILSYHRIKVPHFHTYYKQHNVRLIKRLKLPLIIKPLCEEGSRGIAQASVADNEDAFFDRIRFIHDHMNMDAIAEEYIDGREFYIGVIGMHRIRVFPPREMKFGTLNEDEPRIATFKAKWDEEYQKKWGIKFVFPGRLPDGLEKKIADVARRAYRAFNLQGYVRFDIRVTNDGQIFILEANANPCLAHDDEFAAGAEKIGISYSQLVQKILTLAFARIH